MMESYIQYTLNDIDINTVQLRVLLKIYAQYLESVIINVCCLNLSITDVQQQS